MLFKRQALKLQESNPAYQSTSLKVLYLILILSLISGIGCMFSGIFADAIDIGMIVPLLMQTLDYAAQAIYCTLFVMWFMHDRAQAHGHLEGAKCG